MTRLRIVAAAVACAAVFALAPWTSAPRADAQILPTTTTTEPPASSTTRPRPSTTATTAGTSTTRRSSTTTSPPSTTITTIAPPPSIVEEEAPPAAIEDQGSLSRVFAVLSGLGFAVAFGMMGTRLYQTRREDQQLAARARERAREILSRRALRRSSPRPPP